MSLPPEIYKNIKMQIEVCELETDRFTLFEADLLICIADQFERSAFLTDKQIDALNSLYEKVK